MKSIQVLAAAAVAAASLGLVVVSEAQMMGPGYGPGLGRGGMMGGGPGNGYFAPNGVRNPAANAEARLTALHTALNLRADQEGAWQAYATALTQQSQQMTTFHNQIVQSQTLTPSQRLDLMVQHMQQGATSMGTMATALGGLVAVLDDAQRTTFAQQFGPGFMHGGRWGN